MYIDTLTCVLRVLLGRNKEYNFRWLFRHPYYYFNLFSPCYVFVLFLLSLEPNFFFFFFTFFSDQNLSCPSLVFLNCIFLEKRSHVSQNTITVYVQKEESGENNFLSLCCQLLGDDTAGMFRHTCCPIVCELSIQDLWVLGKKTINWVWFLFIWRLHSKWKYHNICR